MDIGGTKMLGIAVDVDGRPLAEHRAPTPGDPARVLDAVADVVGELGAGGAGSIGVGVPGMVAADGRLRFSPHLPRLVGAPLVEGLQRRFPHADVWVGNDATCAVWAEHAIGVAAGIDDVVMVTLGTGIGGGLMTGGRLLHGAGGFAGEVGHMIVDPHGPPCPCGQRGCWERMASGSGLGRLGREWALAGRAPGVVELAGGDPEAVRGEHVTAAAARGDGPAAELLAELGWWLALGLSNLADVLDPAVVVVGGGLVEAGEALLAPTRRAFTALVEGHTARAGLEVLPAALGGRAGAIGAALLASSPA